MHVTKRPTSRYARGRRRAVAALVGATLALGSASAASATTPAARLLTDRPAAVEVVTVPDAPEDELAAKPYMGWSSYSMQVYSGNGQWITADQIIAQSDAMHESLQPYGYEYINVDAGWNGGVDEYGRPTPSTTLFPDGLQTVIDHVHDNGQKFGLYLIPGIGPEVHEADLPIYGAPGCSTGDIAVQPLQQADYWDIGYRIDFTDPCAQSYVDSIADMLAGWGVDFLKFDSVTPGSGVGDLSLDARDDVAAWSQALEDHDIWFELSWALDIRYADYWKEHAQGWRVDWDVECYCAGEALTAWQNVARLFPRAAQWWRHAGPGGWNDFDSLNVGNGSMDGLTRDERRTAMTFWAVSAAPIYLGNDMTNLDEFGLDLLTNREVIAVNQSGVPARPVDIGTQRQTWYAVHPDGSVTVALFNLRGTESDMAVDYADLGLKGSARVRDLWASRNLGSFKDSFVAHDVPAHGTRLLTLTPAKGSTLHLDDEDLNLTYDGAWETDEHHAVAATSQPFTASIVDSSAGTVPEAGEERLSTLNDDDQSIGYTGSWNHSTGRGLGDHLDDVHWTETVGDSFEHTFVGTGIDYLTETSDSQGEVEIYLDGELVDTVDAHSDQGRAAQQVLYSVRDLPAGTHTLKAVMKSGRFMLLDRLDVVRESLITPDHATFDLAAPQDVAVRLLRDPGELETVEHDGSPLTRGTDYVVDGDTVTLRAAFLETLPEGDAVLDFRFRGDVRDGVHAATQDGSAVELTFRGSAVTWTGPLAPDQGTVDVYLDGRLVEPVDTRADVRRTQQELFTSTGLRAGEHTLRLVKASGEIMRVDAVGYTVR